MNQKAWMIGNLDFGIVPVCLMAIDWQGYPWEMNVQLARVGECRTSTVCQQPGVAGLRERDTAQPCCTLAASGNSTQPLDYAASCTYDTPPACPVACSGPCVPRAH